MSRNFSLASLNFFLFKLIGDCLGVCLSSSSLAPDRILAAFLFALAKNCSAALLSTTGVAWPLRFNKTVLVERRELLEFDFNFFGGVYAVKRISAYVALKLAC